MKQEAIRKLRHRILAGILCFSIVFAAQPNGLKASGLLDTDKEEDFNTDEATEIDTGDSQNMTLTEEPEEDTTEDFDALTEEVFSDEQNEEGTEEYFSENNETENIEGTEEESALLEDSDPVEPQTDTIHQHSISTDCSVSTGEQVNFTELTQDFTGGTLAEGNYYLSEDITLNSTWEVSGTVNLCLNGHILQYGGTAQNCVININSNASLHICDCISTGRISGGKMSGIRINQGHLGIYGGSISDNTAELGGGVYISENAVFEMYGGEISNNHLGSYSRGGGVYNQGTFILHNGTISGNIASEGGGIYNNGDLNMLNGTITRNSVVIGNSTGSGGGVCVNNGNFIMNNGSITYHVGGSGVWIQNKSSFQMNSGTISYNSCESGGGVHLVRESSFEMNGGEISNNSANGTTSSLKSGGGVYMWDNVDFIMNDGLISNNTARDDGGGVCNVGGTPGVSIGSQVLDDSYFIMNGGIISNNTAKDGGGVYLNRSVAGSGSVTRSSIFEISGGIISNNTATDSGGGIYAWSTIMKINGGTVSDNRAVNGGGIYMANEKTEMSGNPIVVNNKKTDDTDNNISISGSFTITAQFGQEARIGITHKRNNTVNTDSPFAIPASGVDIRGDAQYFFSDTAGYGVRYQTDTTEGLYLGDGLTVIYDYAFNGGSSSTLASIFMEKNTTLDLSSDASNAVTAAKEGWEFVGWNTDPDATEGLDTLTVGTTNVTLYAIYKKTITANFYSGNTNQKVTRDITIYNNQTEGIITSPDLADFPGWQAAGWDTDTTGYTGAVPEASDITISEDTDYYGVYQQDVTISYDANGGTITPASETKKRYANVHNSITYRNPVFTLAPAVSHTGYTFDGWHQGSTTGTVKRPGTEVELIGNTTFYAEWTENTDRSYVVEHYWQNVTGDGYTLIDTVPHTGTAEAEAEAEARTYTGFTENTEHPSRKASGIIAEDGSLVLKLYYDRDIYTVSFDLNGAEGTPPEAQTIRYGGTVTPVPAPTWEGYVFTGWYMNDETGSGNRWDFTAAVEENERNQTRIVTHNEIVLYAGWRKEAVDTPNEPVQPVRPTEPDTGNNNDSNNNSNTTINNNVTINNSNAGTSPTSGKPVPMTGDAAHLELYATAAMIAGLSYLLLEMADEQGMTEEKKRELTARLIRWAKQGGAIRRILAFMAMFLILAYYHAIGKQFSAKSIRVLEK